MKKAIVIILAAALLIGATAATTVAWLTASTTKIANVFTVGKIDVTLDELNFTDKKLVPGKTLTKDPRATVTKDSEKCYLFVDVQIDADIAAVIDYEIADGWSLLTTNTAPSAKNYTGIIYKIVENSSVDQPFYILKGDNGTGASKNGIITTKGAGITATELNNVDAQEAFSFTAYAVQYDYISNATAEPARAQAAWDATFAAP